MSIHSFIKKRYIIPLFVIFLFYLSLQFGFESNTPQCFPGIINGQETTVCAACGYKMKYNPILKPASFAKFNLPLLINPPEDESGCYSEVEYMEDVPWLGLDIIYWIIISYLLYRLLKYFSKNNTPSTPLRSSPPPPNNKNKK